MSCDFILWCYLLFLLVAWVRFGVVRRKLAPLLNVAVYHWLNVMTRLLTEVENTNVIVYNKDAHLNADWGIFYIIQETLSSKH